MKKKLFTSFLVLLFPLIVLMNISCSDSSAPAAPTPNPYLISGTLTYTGSLGTVGSNNPVAIELNTSPDFRVSGGFYQQLPTNGASYQLGTPGTGVFNLVAFYRAANPPCDPNIVTGFPIPHQGDPYFIYDGSSCGVSTPITVTAPGTLPINVSFADSCLFNGVSGSVSYTGASTVSSARGIVVELYTDSGYTTLDSTAMEYLTCNKTPYSLGTLSGSTRYLLAFLDLTGAHQPKTGDPYIKYGAVTPSTSLVVNLTFDDTTKF